jgi:hypothetical protein
MDRASPLGKSLRRAFLSGHANNIPDAEFVPLVFLRRDYFAGRRDRLLKEPNEIEPRRRGNENSSYLASKMVKLTAGDQPALNY